MIRVGFEEPETPEWRAWREAAEAATQELIEKHKAGEELKISDRLYKQMRQVLFDAFHGKCAYCERKFVLDQSGDVEHFRPKKAVLDEKGQPVKIKRGGVEMDHPGYFWLAYDWHNLLPSCAKCNRLSRTRDGGLIGKGSRFPVTGARASGPGEEAQEVPVFVHPVFDKPENHFVFDKDTGVLGWKTARGEACIEMLGLNREGMPEARSSVYKALEARMGRALDALNFRRLDVFQEVLAEMNAFKRGEKEFSCAGRKALEDHMEVCGPLRDLLAVLGG